MTEASVPVSRLLVFAALCVGLGPAIGAFVAILQSEMFGPHIGHPLALIFNIRLIGPILLVGYMIGAPVALIAAILFAVMVYRRDWHGLGAANLAAIVATALLLVSVAMLSLARGSRVDLSPHAISNLGAIVMCSIVAITVCWCIARVVGILR